MKYIFLSFFAVAQENEGQCRQYPAPRTPLEGTSGIPVVGLGMCCRPSASGEAAEQAIVDYLKIGGRHIDTAKVYGNHAEIGRGIKKSGIPRKDIFLTSKVWFTDYGRKETLDAVNTYLRDLDTDYVDLLLIHIPGVTKGIIDAASMPPLPACVETTDEQEDWRKCRLETWAALEELKLQGKAKAIGVSNFNPRQMKEIRDVQKFPIQVNQIEIHPFFPNAEFVDYCKENNILVTAYASLGSKNHVTEFLSDKVKGLESIAGKHKKSPSQVLLRWAIQQNFVVIPGTSNRKHMEENQDLFDFKLDAEDMRILHSIPASEYKPTFPHLPDSIM